MSSITEFQQSSPSLDSYWRSIILFGKNVASYKFALANSLIELASTGNTEVALSDLAVPFSTHVCDHLKSAPRQATGRKSTFLEACKQFNAGEISESTLYEITEKHGFNYVLDAFHTVNHEEVPITFFEKKNQRKDGTIVLTDFVYELIDLPGSENLKNETEARWHLVETAWELGVSSNLLNVNYDDGIGQLIVDNSLRRKAVTSARDALNGYQKGCCFYCNAQISLDERAPNLCDVDHFYPHMLKPYIPEVNLDGVWNLVLSCKECNRGAGGKFERVPEPTYLERLSRRNEYLISSHHPLRETLIRQTGESPVIRTQFLRHVDERAIGLLIHRWHTEEVAEQVI